MATKKQSFEDSLKKLEDVVDKMESGDIPLNECLDLYETGVKLSDFCAKELDAAEKRREKLQKDHTGGLETIPLDDNEDNPSEEEPESPKSGG